LYTTTKFAVRGLSESLRADLEKYNIGVSCLCPGAVNTNILASNDTRAAKYGKTGFAERDQAALAELKVMLEAGYDPVDLARVVLESVRRNEFWIFPYPEYVPMIEQKMRKRSSMP
jgi:short-subunit dehydrogenase